MDDGFEVRLRPRTIGWSAVCRLSSGDLEAEAWRPTRGWAAGVAMQAWLSEFASDVPVNVQEDGNRRSVWAQAVSAAALILAVLLVLAFLL